jgi:branched-chain amino acid transport system permease protein
MTKRWLLVFALVAIAIAAVPLAGSNYLLRLGTTMLMYIVLAVSWNFIGGFAGYPSFGAAAFFGLGAYAGAIAQTHGVPSVVAWIFAGALSALFALLLGLAVLRLRGHAFAIATLVVAELMREVVNFWVSLTGGGMGLNLPATGMQPAQAARFYFYGMFALALVTVLASQWVAHSRLGFGLRCIRQNESAASMVGVNTTVFKSLAFALSAVFTAAAGAIYASWTAYIEPGDAFDIMFSIKAIVMVLLGGAGTVLGPVIGAVAFLALDELVWRNFLHLHTGILGLLIVVLILFLPMGLSTLDWRRWLGRGARA